MFGITFAETNLIKLSSTEDLGDLFPVFFEELAFLGLTNYFNIPKTDNPILWAKDINSFVEYYYSGELVAKVKKGKLFKPSEVVYVNPSFEGKTLEPINLKRLIEINRDPLRELENEALDYIKGIYEKFKTQSGIAFMVSYSGGKDSQVVLDLVMSVIPPSEFLTVFTDTQMELPPTLEVVNETEKFYRKEKPKFKIHRVSSPHKVEELWRIFGPPSRIHRWCCTVYKIAPQLKFLETRGAGKLFSTVITFEGTRASESTARSRFERTSPREKTFREINARPIFFWNSTEVFLYIFYKNLPLNRLYRYGLRRVGCSICPFASSWSEDILTRREDLKPYAKRFIRILEDFAKSFGIEDEREIKKYLSSGKWKERAGGLGVKNDVKVEFLTSNGDLKIAITNKRENFFEWLKTVGKVELLQRENGKIRGTLKVEGATVPFEVEEKENQTFVEFFKISNIPLLENKLKKVANKSAYCVHCLGCEIECPHYALKTFPKVEVNASLCTHCGECLNFNDTGCYVAKSVKIVLGMEELQPKKGYKKKPPSVNRYYTFGLRQEWLEGFLSNLNEWFKNNSLGPDQVKAVKNFFLDAQLITKKEEPTKLAEILSELRKKNNKLVLQIVWINLCINSPLFRWYADNIKWGEVWNKKEAIEKLQELGIKERTARNAINSLAQTFFYKNTEYYLGTLFGKRLDKEVFLKRGIKEESETNKFVVGYALYRLKEIRGIKGLTLSELYTEGYNAGPYHWLGISEDLLKKAIRGLEDSKLLSADLVADLDNIHLYEEVGSLIVLEKALEEL